LWRFNDHIIANTLKQKIDFNSIGVLKNNSIIYLTTIAAFL